MCYQASVLAIEKHPMYAYYGTLGFPYSLASYGGGAKTQGKDASEGKEESRRGIETRLI